MGLLPKLLLRAGDQAGSERLQERCGPWMSGWRPDEPPADDERMVSGEWRVETPARHSLFAIRQTSGLLDLRVFDLDGRGAAEDRDRHFQAGAVLVDLLDDAVERGEGA